MSIGARWRRMGAGAVVLAGGAFLATPARAANHLWEISELYTDGSGTVQFVEMHDDSSLEGFLSGLTLTSTNTGATQTHVFTFPANLPDPVNTANHDLLIATAGFGSLPGGVTADYVLPANFLFAGGGTLTYSGTPDSVTYGSLPTDGVNSLTRNLVDHTVAAATNSPTNFAGTTGSVPEPAGAAVSVGGLALLWLRRRRRGAVR